MAKKKTNQTPAAEAVVEKTTSIVEPTPVVAEVKNNPVKPKDSWETKDRTYVLTHGSPLSYIMKSSGIFYFDEEKGYERELRCTKNQRTPFVDEFQGEVRPEHIIFRDGVLFVPKSKSILQKILSLYHPDLGVKYRENKPVEQAAVEVDSIELELQAMNAAQGLDIDMAEAVMRVEIGSAVAEMSSKELKRDLLVFAKSNPKLFLDLMNDENIHLRNVGIKATEMRIIKLSQDNRAFLWGSNDRKLMTVPFDEHPYSALAAWFKTDEGMEVLSTIEKKLK
jgi:hypothetical protein